MLRTKARSTSRGASGTRLVHRVTGRMSFDWTRTSMFPQCAKFGCCDSSPNRHATAHAHESGHPIIRSAEPGEDWSWCCVDEVTFIVADSGSA